MYTRCTMNRTKKELKCPIKLRKYRDEYRICEDRISLYPSVGLVYTIMIAYYNLYHNIYPSQWNE